jgi:hypothetical protein
VLGCRELSRTNRRTAPTHCVPQDLLTTFNDAQAWRKQRKHLFTSWVHVPFGVAFLLVCVWALKQAIDIAPFRFPAPVLAMAACFFLLLILDWFSLKFPSRHKTAGPDIDLDLEKIALDAIEPESESSPQKKRFVDPVMKLLAPPCDFCLRNM